MRSQLSVWCVQAVPVSGCGVGDYSSVMRWMVVGVVCVGRDVMRRSLTLAIVNSKEWTDQKSQQWTENRDQYKTQNCSLLATTALLKFNQYE